MDRSELYERIAEASKTIFSFCMARTPTREEAEDLAQDIVYELLRSAENLRDEKAFYGFMWAVAGNVYRQWYRKRQIGGTCALTEALPAEGDDPAEWPGEGNEDIRLLRRELTLLSEKHRRATILYYIEGRSCAEIASALAISEGMVKYLLFKSRKFLRKGMGMERDFGELSYNPRTLIPLYSGEGPNRFSTFMQSKVRQNILCACYNDLLTPQQISLETGLPLPYIDDEIRELENRQIIMREGKRYRANCIIVTAECADEIERAVAKYHTQLADKMAAFIHSRLREYKSIAFAGSDFSENTLRWQLATVMFRLVGGVECGATKDAPETGWGENAYLWCVEKLNEKHIFSYCDVQNPRGDTLYFLDYWKDGLGKGDHRDFYGNERYIRLFCDVCRGETKTLSEYDLEAIAEMVRKGYVIELQGRYQATVPVYTAAQYGAVTDIARSFIAAELTPIVQAMDGAAVRILAAHTPKALQQQVAGIASMDKFVDAVCIPAAMLVERGVLHTDWHPLEMPTPYMVLND